MIRQIGNYRRVLLARKGIALMLAFWLNLALLPCAMALQTVEAEHDCCPPTLELADAADCCELDDYSVDHRDGKDSVDIAGIVENRIDVPGARQVVRRMAQPPDPDNVAPPLYVQNCAYLK